ncbi:hypothetical protein BN3661_00259 [Eubacteriaceae bacterium CHKCI005]|nr:hypothetical protein BN3661_00259 [Eubacteriaceae bacterium CHKCI005]
MEPKAKDLIEERQIHITQRHYINGTLDVQRRIGILRHTPFVMALDIVILLFTIKWFIEIYVAGAVAPMDYCLLCALIFLPTLLVAIFLNLLPLRFSVRAREDYNTGLVTKQIRFVRFYKDRFELSGTGVDITAYYSKMIQCLENDDLFLFVPDRSGLSYMIPKEDLGDFAGELHSRIRKEMGKRYHKMTSFPGRKDFGRSFDKGA